MALGTQWPDTDGVKGIRKVLTLEVTIQNTKIPGSDPVQTGVVPVGDDY